MGKHIKKILFVVIGLLLLNFVGSYVYKRFDLTQDKRYTLSRAAKATVATVDSPIVVDVFLKGNFPPEFRRLAVETRQILEEFASFNSNVQFEFINPLDDDNPQEAQQLLAQGVDAVFSDSPRLLSLATH